MYQRLERRAEECDEAYVFGTGPSLDRVSSGSSQGRSLGYLQEYRPKRRPPQPPAPGSADVRGPGVPLRAEPLRRQGATRVPHRRRPEKYRDLLVGHYPDLADRVVGLRSVREGFRSPTSERLAMRETSNIITKLMLPIASAVTDHVRIVGADGCEEDESYFWEPAMSASTTMTS